MEHIITVEEKLLRRDELANSLNEAGFPISKATLEGMATRGGGPPFQKFGRYPLYKFSEALAWATERLSKSRGSTSEVA